MHFQIYIDVYRNQNNNLKERMKVVLISLATLLICASSLVCQQGSIPNALNICISPHYIEGCFQYLSETSCKTCEYRYNLNANGLCDFQAQTTQDCCVLRGSDNVCSQCQPGLYLINSKCQDSNIIGCLQKDNRGVCLNCASGFFLNGGSCQKVIINCQEYTDDTKTSCTLCSSGYSLINNVCVQNSILGCKNEVQHVCKECYKPFILSNGVCEVHNCKTYNEYSCATCNCGYYLTAEGVCKSMGLGCIRYQRGVCIDCLPGFKLKGNSCEIEGCLDLNGMKCTKCDTGYDLVDGICNMKNCLVWKDGSCDICKSGYNYQLGKCVQAKVPLTQ